MKLSKVRRRLRESLIDGRIVTAVRDDFELAMTDGYVIALTNDWVVMHALDDGVYLDAVVMLRLEDISRAWFRDDDPYHHRAVAGLNESVTSFEIDASANTIELLAKASEQADIFGLNFETLKGEPLSIGRLGDMRRKSFDMHYVGRDGVWADDVDRWKYRDVTRIEVGGRYLNALNRFADLRPDAEGLKT